MKREKQHRCSEHDDRHVHGPGCGHPPVEHDGHTDYLVGDHRHHVEGGRCTDHGRT
jgi:hypothetical protein